MRTFELFTTEEFEFLLSEYDLTPSDEEEDASEANSGFFAIHRGIRISLRPIIGPVSEAVFEILSELDSRFALNLQDMQRCQICKQCIEEGKYGYFPLENGIKLKSSTRLCSPNLEHAMDKNLVRIMQKSLDPEPFQLQPLMDLKKEDLGLQIFEQSDLKEMMLRGELEKGEQIWVYHDAVTNSNLVSKINPYAHVMVYIGSKEDCNGKKIFDEEGQCIHEVVHVAKSTWHGLVVAGIYKVDIMSVIKPRDMVFLGHKIRACQFSGNVRKKIAERAIACTEKPKLLFAYDHR